MLIKPGYKAVISGVGHAMQAQNAIDTYKTFTKKNNMPPYPLTPRKTPTKRKEKSKPTASKSVGKSRNTMSAPNNTGVALSKAASRTKGKTTNHKTHKKVKVSKTFADKVEKVLAEDDIHGSWTQFSYGAIPMSQFDINKQDVGGLAEYGQDYSDWAFDPEDFLHAASVLWNEKLDSQGTRNWDDPQSLGIYQPIGSTLFGGQQTTAPNSGVSSIAPMNLKMTVKSCFEVYKLKNNTQRTVVMKIYLCAPKQAGVFSLGTEAIPGGSGPPASFPTTLPIGNPGAVWAGSLEKQVLQNINVMGAIAQTVYQKPTDCPEWNKIFRSDCTTVVLEPGQVYDYYIKGPTDLELKFANFFRQTSQATPAFYQGVQKFMRYPLFTAYLDLVTDGTLSGHYPTAVAESVGEGIAVERQMKFRLKMPENVAGRLTVGTGAAPQQGQFQLTSRRSCYGFKVYTQVGPLGPTNRIDVQNPAQEIDIE